MAFLGLELPREVGSLLHAVPVPGHKTGPGSHHITMVYFGDRMPSEDVGKVVEVLAPIMQRAQPFGLVIKNVGTFPQNPAYKPDKVPIIGFVQSPYLLALRERIASVLDQNGIEFSKKFDYKPHVTLSYADPSEELKPFSLLAPIRWVCYGAAFWAGDDEDDRLTVRFQLPHEPKYEALDNSLVAW